MIAVSDPDILHATDILGRKEGLYCEPTGAVTLAAVKDLVLTGRIEQGASVVLLMTGHGFKYTARSKGTILQYHGPDSIRELLG